uniref:Internalin, putative n=1 Tax=uncultured Thiotrichaceae bacterium TaxID=298394 RepID=A0A6S6UDQ5_9GAMM|nr:MAG: internalin, putative [uncultured Thiotrichaceae bacterium]
MLYRTNWGVRCFLLVSSLAVASPAVYAELALNDSPSVTAVSTVLSGPGLELDSLQFISGINGQYGLFFGGTDAVNKGAALGIVDGFYMTTGNQGSILGPNDNAQETFNTKNQYSDPDLVAISPDAVFDPVVLEFNIIPEGDKVNFVLAFGSEEYPEYVCSKFNDVFGLFVSGPGISGTKNAAFVPGTNLPIAVNNINGGLRGPKADGTDCSLGNSIYFVDNGNGGGNTGTQLDGFSRPITASLTDLIPGEIYKVKLALADTADQAYDSAAFFRWLTSTLSTPVDLELAADASTSTPAIDGFTDITYTIKNTSSIATRLVDVGIELPAGVVLVNNNSDESYDALTEIWAVGDIAAGASRELTLRLAVGSNASYQIPAEILFSFNEDPDSTPYNRLTHPKEDDTSILTLRPVQNNAPMITHADSATVAEVSFAENDSGVIVDLNAEDQDGETELSGLKWVLSGGIDSQHFSLSSSGILRPVTLFNYEAPVDAGADNAYQVNVKVCDTSAECDEQALTVNISDVNEDADGDGLSNDLEDDLGTDPNSADTDGDGISDKIEVGDDPVNPVDTDGDGKIDALDTDDDNDSIPTRQENYNGGLPLNDDSDNDGKADYLDADDDNDGLLTVHENYNGGLPLDDDTDTDGTPDYLDTDDDGDSVPTRNEDSDLNGDMSPADAVDTDGDRTVDYLDPDNLNAPDADGDGLSDDLEKDLGTDPNSADTDGDGISDKIEVGDNPANPVNTDADGKIDALDADDDNDSIPTRQENYNGGLPLNDDSDNDGKADYLDADDDNDGLLTLYENYNGGLPLDDDTNRDGTPDYLDRDDDGDGLLTRNESSDSNGDGNPADAVDTEGDGVVDYLDPDNLNAPDDDNDDDGLTNAEEGILGSDPDDPDTDGDGVNDKIERGDGGLPIDSDNDGVANLLDPDDDNDGVLTMDENYNGGSPLDDDTDSDRVPDYLDTDDDSDGVPTRLEDYNGNDARDDDTDSDKVPDYLDADDDGDGISTWHENYNRGLPLDDDTDLDGIADYLDADDDNDGLLTKNEAPDLNGNGNPDDGLDSDKDGLNDYRDADDDNDGRLTIDEFADPDGDGDPADAQDNDLDGIVEYLDPEITPFVRLNVRAMLQGPYVSTTGLMQDSLRTEGVLPNAQPYGSLESSFGYGSLGNLSPFDYRGTEAIADGLLSIEGANAIVDWVLIEVRDAQDPTELIGIKAGVLQRDGDVVIPETGSKDLIIPHVRPGEYYVAVRHRNHLGVMTAQPVTLYDALQKVELYDFSSKLFAAYGANALSIAENHQLMMSGDLNNSNTIVGNGIGSDMSVLLGAVLVAPDNEDANANYPLEGYYSADLNMDGTVLHSGPSNDINLIMMNILMHPDNNTGSSNFTIQGTVPE